jgi:anti-anti-sigma factor
VNVHADESKTVAVLADSDIAGEQAIRDTTDQLCQLIYQGARYLVVDLKETALLLSSAVLAMFIKLHKMLYIADGVFVIRNPRPEVDDLFRITRLSEILDIEHDEPDQRGPLAGD